MPGYVLTGTPGAGKTAVLRLLETGGQVVVEEAATDTIALDHALGLLEPRHDNTFIDRVVALQRQRQRLVDAAATVFFDRSPVCGRVGPRPRGRPRRRRRGRSRRARRR